MKLSIVVPLYNSENFIRPCVESLVIQKMDSALFEILLIDDGSEDNSLKIIEELEQTHTNVHAYHKENGGTGDARNFGMDKATGTYLYFLDIDDYLAHDTLHIILENIEQNQLDVLCFDSIKTTARDLVQTATTLFPDHLEIMDGISYIGKKGFEFEVWHYIIRREFLVSSGIRFDSESILEDSSFTVHLFIAAERIAKIPIDVHRYIQHPASATYRTEKAHARRILNDLENMAVLYGHLIEKYAEIPHQHSALFLKQLQAKKQFFVYYYVVRAYKGDISFNEVWKTLQRMKLIHAYPFKVISYNEDKLAEKLKYIFNRKILLFLLFRGFKPVWNLKQKVSKRLNILALIPAHNT